MSSTYTAVSVILLSLPSVLYIKIKHIYIPFTDTHSHTHMILYRIWIRQCKILIIVQFRTLKNLKMNKNGNSCPSGIHAISECVHVMFRVSAWFPWASVADTNLLLRLCVDSIDHYRDQVRLDPVMVASGSRRSVPFEATKETRKVFRRKCLSSSSVKHHIFSHNYFLQ
jgi:hypothetical protein